MKYMAQLAVGLITVVAATAFAGGSAVITTGQAGNNHNIRIEWLSPNIVRRQVDGTTNYILYRDGKTYMVAMNDGRAHVTDMSGMLSLAGAAAKHMAGTDATRMTTGSFKRTGSDETVAGIRGHVYVVSYTDADGNAQKKQVVLTNNRHVTELTRAYFSIARAALGAGSNNIADGFPGKDKGILRVADGYTLVSISGKTPANKDFELPAKPVNVADKLRESLIYKPETHDPRTGVPAHPHPRTPSQLRNLLKHPPRP